MDTNFVGNTNYKPLDLTASGGGGYPQTRS